MPVPKKPPSDALIARAAERRAEGATWDAVAAAVGRAADTVRRWPAAYPGRWKTAFRAAERQLLAEATAEAVHTLRRHLRSADEKVSRDAAHRLIQFRVAAGRRAKPAAGKPAPAPPPARGEFHRFADFLEGLSDADRDRLLAELAPDPGPRPVGDAGQDG